MAKKKGNGAANGAGAEHEPTDNVVSEPTPAMIAKAARESKHDLRPDLHDAPQIVAVNDVNLGQSR